MRWMICLLLVGCVSQPVPDDPEFIQADYRCTRESMDTGVTVNTDERRGFKSGYERGRRAAIQKGLYRKCMRAAGY